MKIRKVTRKLLAIMFVFAMIIPTVFFAESNKQEVKAAESVSTEMLEVKLQVEEDRQDAIRFISTVDSLDYSSVGFEITTPEGIKTYQTTKVYERITSCVTNENYEFSPKLIDVSSKYFVTAILAAQANTEYSVRAFVTTKEAPTVKVYGPSRKVSLGDNANNTINMVVDFATTENATYDVYNGETKIGTAKVIADKNVRITLEGHTATGFKSATLFTFKEGSTEVGASVYRNYYTKYAGTGTEDTSWYDVNKTAKQFVVATSADLYGLSKLVNEGKDVFAGDTVIQVRNIEINKGAAGSSAWTPSGNEKIYEWTQIGNSGNKFSGTYDGDHNAISGVVDVQAISGSSGLFGYTTYGSLVSNLKVVNSQFTFGYKDSGTIIGNCMGSLSNIYVGEDVYVKSSLKTDNNPVGGIVGLYLTAAESQTNEIKNCWFAGTLEGYGYVGGIVGSAYRGRLTLENCLLTGTVISTKRVGGLIGAANGESASYQARMTIKNSISAGTIKTSETHAAGTVIGMPVSNGPITIENVYSNENRIYTGTGTGFTTSNTAIGIGYLGAAGTVNGVPMKVTDNLNGAKGYANTEFDFWSEDNEEGVWLAVEGSIPVLRAGANVNSAIQELSGKRYSVGWYNNAYTCGTAKTMQLPDAATFELDSAADLNGFEVYCNNVTNFAGKTVKLTKDIYLNGKWVPSVNESGALTNGTGVLTWSPIGKNGATSTQFNGIFDGQGHAIHGVYVNATTRDAGFFGYTGVAAQIKNVKMYDSYINAAGQSFAGGVVGLFCGTLIENVYVDESVSVFGATAVGGICGAVFPGATRTISKCWFDGNIYSTNMILGGIVGYIVGGTNTISDGLVTGTITSTKPAGSNASTGGIIGENIIEGTKVIDCLSIGTIYVNSKNQVNPVCGYSNKTDTIYTNVYTTNEVIFTADKTYTFNVTVGTLVSKDAIKANAATTLPALYSKQNTVWSVGADGMPILNISK